MIGSDSEDKTAKIARLNDAFRANPMFGLLMLMQLLTSLRI